MKPNGKATQGRSRKACQVKHEVPCFLLPHRKFNTFFIPSRSNPVAGQQLLTYWLLGGRGERIQGLSYGFGEPVQHSQKSTSKSRCYTRLSVLRGCLMPNADLPLYFGPLARHSSRENQPEYLWPVVHTSESRMSHTWESTVNAS